MKNNLKNKLVIHGTGEQVNEVLNFLKIERAEEKEIFYGFGAVDFNKIVKMPDHIITVNDYRETNKGEMKISIDFVTAWSPDIELIIDLSAKFTNVIIEYGWSDYQFGNIIGYAKIKAGRIDPDSIEGPNVGTRKIDELSQWIFS